MRIGAEPTLFYLFLNIAPISIYNLWAIGGVHMIVCLQMIETNDDKSKFEIIYQEYKGLMFHVAYKYLKHQQDAEDADHHAFVEIAEGFFITDCCRIFGAGRMWDYMH